MSLPPRLLERLRRRAESGGHRGATPAELRALERDLGFALHPAHAAVLRVAGDGEFGPGCGLLSVAHGVSPLWRRLALPPGLAPFCDWGCGVWSCVESRSGDVITCSDQGLHRTPWTLERLLEQWLDGVDVGAQLLEPGEARTFIDPFTRTPRTVRGVGPAIGEPYEA